MKECEEKKREREECEEVRTREREREREKCKGEKTRERKIYKYI